jgi:hypothetical protein
MEIVIKKSPTADTRTCDFSKVSIEQLRESSENHIGDVKEAMCLFRNMILHAANDHDRTKLSHLEQFHEDFKTGFNQTSWYELHKKEERHHLDSPDGVRDDVNLIDVLEHVCDCVMAGMARSGQVRPLNLPDEVLKNALQNTVNLLVSRIKVID